MCGLAFGLAGGLQAQQPGNDLFGDRFPLGTSSGSFPGSNENATLEPNEPLFADGNADESIWYTWTAPSAGTVTFSTIGTDDFSHILVVYTGGSLATLQSIGQGIAPSGTAATVQTSAPAGTVYQIVIVSYIAPFEGGQPISRSVFHLLMVAAATPVEATMAAERMAVGVSPTRRVRAWRRFYPKRQSRTRAGIGSGSGAGSGITLVSTRSSFGSMVGGRRCGTAGVSAELCDLTQHRAET